MFREVGGCIETIRLEHADLTPEEAHLCRMGQEELSHLCRSLRLANPYDPQSAEGLLWNDQAKWNVPILVQSSLYLHEFCKIHRKSHILFTSRDGCLWIQLFRQMFPQYKATYFHASRHAYLRATPSYVEYVRSQYSEDALIVDANGRGATCELFFTTHLKQKPTYLAIVNCGDKHHGMIRSEIGCYALEMLNYDTCGLLYDVQDQTPMRREVEYPLTYIRPMHACVQKCLEWLPFYSIQTFELQVLQWAIDQIRAGVAIERYITHQVTPPGIGSIDSFDFFDTLVGRLHYHPQSVFELVEKLFPFPGFLFFRIAAACRSDHTLAGIYREFQKLTGISDQEASTLMQFEFETERKYLFPIQENVQRLKEGDLVVSDTYYDTEQIQSLLQKVGIHCKVNVYASPNGKGSGAAWAFLKNNYLIRRHLGDSLHTDVKMAKRYNLEAALYTNGALSETEQTLFNMGQKEMSYLCRALRLSNPYPHESPKWFLWNDQCAFNVPILVHASLFLAEFCKVHEKRRILFTARDSCLWIRVFRHLFPEIESIYFHSSRHAYRQATPSYIEYVRGLYTDESVIVDVQGKGSSCEQFFTTHMSLYPTYLAIVNCGERHHAILRQEASCEQIEMLNYDLCGTLVDVQNGEPIRRELEYDPEYVEPMHGCMDKCLELLPLYNISVYDPQVVEWAVGAIRSGLSLNRYLLLAYWHSDAYHNFMKSIQKLKDHLQFQKF